MKSIPLAKPYLTELESQAVSDVMSTGWLGMGQFVEKFEQALNTMFAPHQAVAVNTGTSALHLALESLNLHASDEVLVPSLTYAASIQAITAAGAKPVFVDIDQSTLNICLKDLQRKINKKSKVIMPVHFSGLACPMHELINLKNTYNLHVIEDAAHAFGSTYQDKLIGSTGDITCFSFDPIKNITCGEGGAILSANTEFIEQLKCKRVLGINKNSWNRYQNKNPWEYSVKQQGFRYHMSNINAAIGLQQLQKLPKILERKKAIVQQYDRAFKDIPEVRIPYRDYSNTAYFNYCILIKDKRTKLLEHLAEHKITAGINYPLNHQQEFFKQFSTEPLPVTEKIGKQIISLPLYYELSEKQITYIIEKIYQFFQ